MATPIEFPAVNTVFRHPDCLDLPVHVRNTTLGRENMVEVISAWKLSEEELAEVTKTGIVYIRITGGQPPVYIGGIDPFSQQLPETLEAAVDFLLDRFQNAITWDEFYQGEDAFLARCNSMQDGDIARFILAELRLWEHERPLHQHFLSEHGLYDPDQMNELIIRNIYRKLVQPE